MIMLEYKQNPFNVHMKYNHLDGTIPNVKWHAENMPCCSRCIAALQAPFNDACVNQETRV